MTGRGGRKKLWEQVTGGGGETVPDCPMDEKEYLTKILIIIYNFYI